MNKIQQLLGKLRGKKHDSNGIYDSLVDYAYSLVNIANKSYLKGERMAYYALITGGGYCLVESRPGAGHNYQAVIDAIHLYDADHPNSKANKGFEEDLSLLCELAGRIFSIDFAINCIIYEIEKEKEGSNSFKMDCQGLLNKLSQTIQKKHEKIKSTYPDIDKYVEETRLFLKKIMDILFK